ncbi:MAG TPA: DUF2795 domain-containing protein [Actinophytocola sp.]|jgi:hypothetical protein|nr:DUF2795 domain-containing protein [Actinophytocola sp.]
MDTMEAPSLSEILDDLTFPADKWQITTCADLYGADVHTRRALYGLPAHRYQSANDVTTTLAGTVDEIATSARATAG